MLRASPCTFASNIYSTFTLLYFVTLHLHTHIKRVRKKCKLLYVAGVPQGSVLCPILGLIYINNLPLFLSHSFADISTEDTTLSTYNKSLDVVVTSLTNILAHIDKWCQRKQMSINSDKSNVMFISSKQNRQLVESYPEIP